MSRTPVELSLILAVYNEEPHLEESVREIRRTLALCPWTTELIFIDDASSDRSPEIVRRLADGDPAARTFFHEENAGRGATVAEGIRIAAGEVVGFIDVDLEVHCRYSPSMVQAIVEDGYDVATAHRIYKFKFTPPAIVRWLLSTGYRKFARVALGSPFEDTETGFKFFRRERFLPVLERCRDPRWFWDTELMLEARRAGLRVVEIPALFQRKPARHSSLRVVPDTLAYLRAVRAYRARRRREERDG